ncbi:MAG: tRNA (adenosine(37)-N6)-threonylcarbamoyltransferase complex ATPase subunit type 1 TsaE [Planctomycetota bacterium]|nr:tRNA (adenosine(37)-N6)-threonylcarbamoyltransferase complex ATPase subunit type 1 TsaE [Planctomycetota bacterium]
MNQTRTMIVPNAAEMESLGERIASLMAPGDCICLDGELGSGKTCLVRGIARGLGCDERSVSSPTFVSMQSYQGRDVRLVHIDAYRMQSAAECASIGLEELLATSDTVIAVEWSTRVRTAFPKQCLCIHIEHVAEGRFVTIHDERSTAI